MRPRLLELTAFGPYAGTVRIDFADLAADGLFLVHGPTGAGKTSLLDGMTYALYGGVSGSRRNDRLRSDHADPYTTTAVSFEFSLRERDYRITRTPPHERAKKTGSGTTKQKPKATLSVRAGDRWEPLAEGVEEVGDSIIDLVGLTREQFQQVVVLPQGDFARALQADAHERRRLLSSLFRTERFEAYTQALLARARNAEETTAVLGETQARLAGQIVDRWSLITSRAGLSEQQEPPAPDRVAADAAAAAAAAQQRAEAAGAAARRAAEELDEARRRAERLQRAASAYQVLAQLEATSDEIADYRERLDRAERAEPVQPYVLALDAADADQRSADDRLGRAAAALADLARDADGIAEAHLSELVAARPDAGLDPSLLTGARDGLTAALARLEQLGAREERARELAADAAAHVHNAGEQRAAAEAASARARQLTADRAAAEESVQAACRAAERVPALSAEHQRMTAAATAAAEAQVLQARCRELADHRLACKQTLNDALDVHRRLLEQRIDGMAVELAAALVDGQPCEVCGSLEHPRPAVGEASAVSVVALRAAADSVEVARAALNDSEAAAAAVDRKLQQALAAAGAADADPESLAAQAESVGANLGRARAEAGALEPAQREVAQLAGAIEAELQQANAAALVAATAQTNADAAAEQSAALLAEVAAALGNNDAASALTEVRTAIELIDELCAANTGQERARTERTGAQQRLDEALERAGFDDVEAARAATLPAQQREALRAQLQQIDAQRAAALAVVEDLPDADADIPDVAALAQAAAAADAAAAAAQIDLGVIGQAADDIATLTEARAAGAAQLAAAATDAQRLRNLADICTGTGNAQRMSLERYVLAAYFEEIADAASIRLQAMSDGRYTLRHSDTRARAGAASGLSITVLDAFTGTEREAGTLSGGETFQASLCLALGVAEVVQRHAGGVHLDTLFVDEGFGSLDADALEQAMAELDSLREGGRMVGVISHVPALRERITSGIAVTKTANGSDARVVVLAEV